MKFTTRTRPAPAPAGIHGPARVDRRTSSLLPRLRAGDVAVIDQLDLDRATAQSLVDAGVVAVLNASSMISGRFPNLGPEVLATAGVTMVDELGPQVFDLVRDGDPVLVEGPRPSGAQPDGAQPYGAHLGGAHLDRSATDRAFVQLPKGRVLDGRPLDAKRLAELLQDARAGLAHQLESFTHNTTEFLRREQDVLLHGRGVPSLVAKVADRPVVVVVPGADFERQLKQVRRFVAEQKPVVIGVDRAAEQLRQRRIQPDVVVLSASDDADAVSAKTLRQASDVVVRVDRGAPRQVAERFSKLGVRPRAFESTATTEDVALLLADAGGASVIVGVGLHATLSDFLDRQRAGLASTYLTRLKVGPRLVDATAVGTVYSGSVRPRHLVAVLIAGLVAVAAALGTTPVGQEWSDDLSDRTSSVIDTIQGKFS